jgi:hypothetical protein
MSLFAATTVSSCRMHVGWLGVALSALTLLPPAVAIAATTDPALRRSEQLDTRRLGKVSNDERSVLRVEWRAALTGAEEAHTVQEMLNSLRRMEVTVGEISRLFSSIPARKPVAEVIAIEQPASGGFDPRLWLANIATACFVALWWFGRQNSAKHPKAATDLKPTPEASPPTAASPVAIVPAMALVAEGTPAETATSDMSAELPTPTPAAQETSGEAPLPESRTKTGAVETESVPTPISKPNLEWTVPPKPVDTMPPAPPPEAESNVIDFLLEDADPEVVARENLRLQKLQAMNRRKAPERQQKSNVEPTLELAGIMLSLGLEQGAAQALVEYTEANPRQALHHWLKLLDIYRSSGNQEEFKEAAEKLRQNFNIQAENWAKASAGEAPTLEHFSRVSEHIQQAWSRPAECIDYLRNLLEDTREGSRAGFPQAVAEEILLLIDILKANQA